MAMTAKWRRDVWVQVAQHSAVAAIMLMLGLMLGLMSALMSGRPVGGELVGIAKLLAIYAVVVAAVKLHNEWVAGTLALVAGLAVLPLALVALARGEWWQAAILAVTVVLAVRHTC